MSWAEVAAGNDRVAHAAMDWVTITGSERYLHGVEQPGLWDCEPDEGSLPIPQSRRLSEILSAQTTTPDHCWFGVWDGFGHIEMPDGVPKLRMPNRAMWLFSGPVDGWVSQQGEDSWSQNASLWWPDDCAWCVATDVDLMTTYLAGSEECVNAVVEDGRIEAMGITLDQWTTWDKDAINPPPEELDRAP